jgi:hypothetical protein
LANNQKISWFEIFGEAKRQTVKEEYNEKLTICRLLFWLDPGANPLILGQILMLELLKARSRRKYHSNSFRKKRMQSDCLVAMLFEGTSVKT